MNKQEKIKVMAFMLNTFNVWLRNTLGYCCKFYFHINTMPIQCFACKAKENYASIYIGRTNQYAIYKTAFLNIL